MLWTKWRRNKFIFETFDFLCQNSSPMLRAHSRIYHRHYINLAPDGVIK
jgi:hypothetical protein